MGVLNCTPDSFSDGGQFLDERAALEHAERMLACGADLIDIGAESTRPRAERVDPEQQIARIGAIVRTLARAGAHVSIDTCSPVVAARALDDGAILINSVELAPAAELGRVAHERGAALALMHSRGAMSQMSGFSATEERAYGDVVADVKREWSSARDQAAGAGLGAENIVCDPGLGFHKSARHSLELCTRLRELASLGHPILVGPSRKSFLAIASARPGDVPAPVSQRLGATIAACLLCARNGAAILRVHDPAEVRQALAFEASSLQVGARHA